MGCFDTSLRTASDIQAHAQARLLGSTTEQYLQQHSAGLHPEKQEQADMPSLQLYGEVPAIKRQKVSDSAIMPQSHWTNLARNLDIRKYIPAGCLRMFRSQCSISSELWKSCNEWRTLWHPGDLSYDDSHLQHVSIDLQ